MTVRVTHCIPILTLGLGLSSMSLKADAPPATQPAGPTTQPVAATQPAIPQTQPAEPAKPYSLFTTERLTGNWGGFRNTLEDAGITFDLSLVSVYQQNVHGGLKTHPGHPVTGTAAYELTLNLEKLGLAKGGTLYTLAESAWGDDIGLDRVGSLWGTNGAAYLGNEEIVVSELWYEQTFLGEKARFRLGKIDLTNDFATNAYANDETTQFLNNALVNTPNACIPDRGMGAQLMLQPTEWLYTGIAAADAQAEVHHTGFDTAFHREDYFFAIAETGLTPKFETRRGQLPGSYRFGLWYDPQPKDRFFEDLGGKRLPPPPKRDDVGFYFNLDQMLWKEKPQDESDRQGLGLFFRYAWANERCNQVEHFWSLGAQYQGLVPTRDNDVLGFGFAQGIISDKLHSIEGGDRESVYELYYRIEVFPWLHLTPDFQYITNPGGNDGRDAFVAGVRVLARF